MVLSINECGQNQSMYNFWITYKGEKRLFYKKSAFINDAVKRAFIVLNNPDKYFNK